MLPKTLICLHRIFGLRVSGIFFSGILLHTVGQGDLTATA